MRWSSSNRGARFGVDGFTLIELMVVISTLGILMAMLVPSVSRARAVGVSTVCLSNQRQLQAAFLGYAQDHSDEFPSNNFVYVVGLGTVTMQSWAPGNPQTDMDDSHIREGILHTYLGSSEVYRCPGDRSFASDGTKSVPRTRSYMLNVWLNSIVEPGGSVTFQDVGKKPLSDTFAFICANEVGIMDAAFGIKQSNHPQWANVWFDQPSDRHQRGTTLSFLDGHAERWEWKSPRVFRKLGQPVGSTADLQDLRRLQAALPAPLMRRN